MLARLARLARLAARPLVFSCLAACEEPTARTEQVVTGMDDGIVLELAGDGSDYGWSTKIRIQGPPSGEWFLFYADRPPTTLEGVDAFDRDLDCRGGASCAISGLGNYEDSEGAGAAGAALLETWDMPKATKQYLILVRRNGKEPGPVEVKVSVDATIRGMGCEDPPAPTIRTVERPQVKGP